MGRIGVIGLGWVGTSVATAVLQQGLASELLINDVRTAVAEGEALDFADAALLYPAARVRAVPFEEMTGADAIVVAAGRGGRPVESRLDLLRDNARIAYGLASRLTGYGGVVIMVSNPVDLLTEVFREAAGLSPARMLGTGTTLDSMRLRKALADELGIHPQSVHAQVLGEHGDSQVVNWSAAQVAGRPLRGWPSWSVARERIIAERVRQAAYEIIRRKGATNHAIGMVTANVLSAVLNDQRRVLNVSRRQEGALGLHEVALSLPAVVGAGGAEQVIEPNLDAEERQALLRSADLLRGKLAELAR